MYNKLGLGYLSHKLWIRRLCLFCKIFLLKSPKYLYDVIPSDTCFYATRNNRNISSFNCSREQILIFFSDAINELNKLDVKITNITSCNAFKKFLWSLIEPLHFDIFGIHNPVGWQLVKRLHLGWSHLNEHKFKHHFYDLLCNFKPETTYHYLLCCQLFQIEWRALLNGIKTIVHKNDLGQILIYENEHYRYDTNRMVLLFTTN